MLGKCGGMPQEDAMIVESKLKAFVEEFPALRLVLEMTEREYDAFWSGRSTFERWSWKDRLLDVGQIKVSRADLALLEKTGFVMHGGVHSRGERRGWFIAAEGERIWVGEQRRYERLTPFKWFHPSTWFPEDRLIEGESVRDLILRAGNPDVVFESEFTDYFGRQEITIHKPRKDGVTLKGLAEDQGVLATAEVREEVASVDTE